MRSAMLRLLGLPAVLVAAGCWTAGEGIVLGEARTEGRPMTGGPMAPPPDYEAVLLEEYRGAVDAGTSAALIRFIARHPDHRLADEARARLAGRSAPDPVLRSGDPDAGVYAEFDEARRRGTPAAFEAFIRRHPGHPLAAEAERSIAGR